MRPRGRESPGGPYRVGVIGLGVAGAAIAHLLARDGHRITLLERAEEPRPIGAGILLQCSGQEVLQRLGVLGEVLAHAAPLDELHARHEDGRTLIRTRYPDLAPECKAYGLHRGVLFNALWGRVRSAAVDVRLGCDVTGRVVRPNDEVYLTDAWGERHGPFDFVIAADGSRSRFRQACGVRASVTKYAHGTLWVTAPGSGVPGKLLQVVRGNRHLLGLLPLGDGLVSLYWGLPAAQFEQVKSRGLDALKDEILAFCPEAAGVLDVVVAFEQFLLTTYQHVHLWRWYDRWTLFIGDACHAMSPHLGQGANLALVDAWRFAACLRTASSPQAAFQAFRQAQRSYLRYYATITYLLSPFFQSDWRVLGWGRDLALSLLPWIPFVKRQMLLTVTGLKGGFLSGRIDLSASGGREPPRWASFRE
jgi:2-polyprenyl-6-methoxyphenol hydroxylase-like FAD-dependent oxidoreductase